MSQVRGRLTGKQSILKWWYGQFVLSKCHVVLQRAEKYTLRTFHVANGTTGFCCWIGLSWDES